MINKSRCREKTEGRVGRNRAYICRKCGIKFSRFLLRSLPLKARICNECLKDMDNLAEFHNAFEERNRKEQGLINKLAPVSAGAGKETK